MELVPAEVKTLENMIQEWITHSTRELEATFGSDGTVDITTFLQIISRLRAKKYEIIPNEEKLNIITPSHVRFTLTGLGTIQAYCKDDSLAGKAYTAIIKDRLAADTNVSLIDYDVRVKVRREAPVNTTDITKIDPEVARILSDWAKTPKAFRLIRRWTFRGKGVQFDLSMIRSTPRNKDGNFRWARTFTEQNFLDQPPIYEAEVELLHDDVTDPKIALSNLIRGIGEILRGIQKNSLLIRNSVRSKILSEYSALAETPKFRGVAPKTLQLTNMLKTREPNIPNIRDGYNVTDKADGLRVMGFCDEDGDLWMIDMGLNVYKTGLRRKACANSLLDCEWVTHQKDKKPMNSLLLFDCYKSGNKKVSNLPFKLEGAEKEDRYTYMDKWIKAWLEGTGPENTAASTITVGRKDFHFAVKDDIFQKATICITKNRVYHTDGLIFTESSSPLPEMPGVGFDKQFKWKPADENTIDFLVVTEKSIENPKRDKITVGVHPETQVTTQYKTLRLFVGSSRDVTYDDPRSTILNGTLQGAPAQQQQRGKRAPYRPVLFTPENYSDNMASVCYRDILLDNDTSEQYIACESDEPINDKSIIEMRYEPGNEPGWRWIPLRVRSDKTERYQRGTIERTLNSEMVANANWNSIYEPITRGMITTGRENPTPDEIATLLKAKAGQEIADKVYYDRKAPKNDMMYIRGMRDFHNHWIKERLLLETTLRPEGGTEGRRKKLIDLACGKAGDIQKWKRLQVDFALGVDFAGENIKDPNNGAYRRLMDTWATNKRENVPDMLFVIGDSSKSLVSGEAGLTPEDQRMLQSVFGKEVSGAVPQYVEKTCSSRLKQGADVIACMFAIHYFFESAEKLNGLLENIRNTLKVNGYFVGCAFDGDMVFRLLENVEKGASIKKAASNGAELWSITKQYDVEELPTDDEGFGLQVDVNFISIGTPHPEYLVPFKLLTQKMAIIGCQLLSDDEAQSVLGLAHSSSLFGDSYGIDPTHKNRFPMADAAVKQFSFLNRWFIFRRITDGRAADMEETTNTDAVLLPKEVSQARPGTLASALVAPVVAAPTPAAPAAVPAAAPGLPSAAPPSAAAAAVAQPRTIPVEPSRAAPAQKVAALKKSYAATEIFLFFHKAALKDSLGIKFPGAGRWLALNAPFSILDSETEQPTEYPTVEHFLAGMKVKHASSNPNLAAGLFGRYGSIHTKYVNIRVAETAVYKRDDKITKKSITEERDYELLIKERDDVLTEASPANIRQHNKTEYDEAKWALLKEKMLREALKQRYTKDVDFIRTVNAAREKGKYLLYYSMATTNDLGGHRAEDGMIIGENRVGKIIMELAQFAP